MQKRNLILRIQYSGKNYHGWQRQPDALSIQEILETTLEKFAGEKIIVTAASRTDAGVHALDQTISFKTCSKMPVTAFHLGLNTYLPGDIRILEAQEGDSSFNARWSSKGKTYNYFIYQAEKRNIFLDPIAWHIEEPLELALINQAAASLIGEHDFSAFRASGCGSKNPVRVISESFFSHSSFLFTPFNEIIFCYTITGTAFLKQMVRSIVGTLVEVGLKKTTVEEFQNIFISKDRKLAGRTAPARGLFLKKVFY